MTNHFLRENIVDIDAAVVGISKDRWTFIEEGATEVEALKKMQEKRFDILPIHSSSSEIKSYFHTNEWSNYTSISRKDITHLDVISLHMSIRDVIKGFAVEDRLFYFLSNGHRVVGLVSIVNLNSRLVKVYLFNLLSELEVRLGNFVSQHVDEYEVYNLIFGGNVKGKHREVKDEYEATKAKGVDTSIVEYLYLADLQTIIAKKGLHSKLGYSKNQFKTNLGSLNDLRNKVDHPARSIISHVDHVNQLWHRIERIEEALFKLRQAG